MAAHIHLLDDDERVSAPPVVVSGERVWDRTFFSDETMLRLRTVDPLAQTLDAEMGRGDSADRGNHMTMIGRAAAAGPARRAMRIEPTEALRSQRRGAKISV